MPHSTSVKSASVRPAVHDYLSQRFPLLSGGGPRALPSNLDLGAALCLARAGPGRRGLSEAEFNFWQLVADTEVAASEAPPTPSAAVGFFPPSQPSQDRSSMHVGMHARLLIPQWTVAEKRVSHHIIFTR